MTLSSICLIRCLCLALLVPLVSCDVRTELKEMHNSTQNMEKNTEKMVEITDRMSKTTEKMADDVAAMKQETKEVKTSVQEMGGKMEKVNGNVGQLNGKFDTLQGNVGTLTGEINRVGTGIDETYDGLRQGDSSTIRRNSFVGVLNARTMERKLSEAAQYFAGFEFYFWRGLGIDSVKDRREVLLSTATDQFFKDIYEFYNYNPKGFSLADPLMGNSFNKEASFNAMAAALHRDNPKQAENIKLMADKGVVVENLNFLKLIEQGLTAKINVEDGKITLDQVPVYLKSVIMNQEISVKLLQSRWNFLVTAALDKSFHFNQNGSFRYMRSILNLATKWELDFSKLNTGEIADQIFDLEQATQTRDFLNSIGIATKPDPIMQLFIKRMTVKNPDKVSAESKDKVQYVLKMIDSFKQ